MAKDHGFDIMAMSSPETVLSILNTSSRVAGHSDTNLEFLIKREKLHEVMKSNETVSYSPFDIYHSSPDNGKTASAYKGDCVGGVVARNFRQSQVTDHHKLIYNFCEQ